MAATELILSGKW